MSKLRSIKIEGPKDFSKNIDLYLSGEKNRILIMEALRIIQHPLSGRITIDLPAEFQAQEEVEIIVLPYVKESKKKNAFDPTKFPGAAKLNMTV